MNHTDTYVAFIPGGGWLIERTNDDGSIYTEPIIGWALTADGTAHALEGDGHGGADRTDQIGRDLRLYHPDAHLLTAEKQLRTCTHCRRFLSPGATACRCGEPIDEERQTAVMEDFNKRPPTHHTYRNGLL
ncbi:hypothetical protein ACFWHF_14525 [Streptomyces griseoincarnatus]